MRIAVVILIALAALAFVLAVVGVLFPSSQVLGIQPEAYSRASTNLALLAVATSLLGRGKSA